MSVDNHRHCQLTVLAATGIPPEQGRTWDTISELEQELTNLPDGWVIDHFKYNADVTDDLIGILALLDRVAGNISQILPEELITISSNNTISVNCDIPYEYEGTIGVEWDGDTRKLVPKEINVVSVNPDGRIMATMHVGNNTLYIRDLSDLPTERYIVSEDYENDIILSGTDDGVFLDYLEPEEPEPHSTK